MAHLPNTLKCFVASAFDRPDVDKLYDFVIRPALKKFNIACRAVNRIEHNKNIDQKIIELIEQSDLMIADLTYARPSVYFEAGYAERHIPVIYTARHDHFRQRDDDPNGTECVHFDLTKRNIIPWKSSALGAARTRLTKRIAHVSRPLFLRLAKDRLEDQRTQAFDALSQRKKLEGIYKRCSASLMQKKYHLESIRERESSIFAQFTKILRRNLIVINCTVRPTATKKYFASLKFAMDLHNIGVPRRYLSRDNATIRPRNVNHVVLVWLEISLRRIQPSTLLDVFSMFDISNDRKHLYSANALVSSDIPIPYLPHICIVDALRNDVQFDENATSAIHSVENGCA
jgi:hypothetical protein